MAELEYDLPELPEGHYWNLVRDDFYDCLEIRRRRRRWFDAKVDWTPLWYDTNLPVEHEVAQRAEELYRSWQALLTKQREHAKLTYGELPTKNEPDPTVLKEIAKCMTTSE